MVIITSKNQKPRTICTTYYKRHDINGRRCSCLILSALWVWGCLACSRHPAARPALLATRAALAATNTTALLLSLGAGVKAGRPALQFVPEVTEDTWLLIRQCAETSSDVRGMMSLVAIFPRRDNTMLL